MPAEEDAIWLRCRRVGRDPVAEGPALKFMETDLMGAWLIESVPSRDSRGSFTRTFCAREFGKRGLVTSFVQHSMSHSRTRGTLRGMHFQIAPHDETKLVACRQGAIWDVIIDLRPASPTYRRWQAFWLTAENFRQLYVPAGFAHGFQALSDDAEVSYLISAFHEYAASAGYRYDDPAFAIDWPLPVTAISDRDTAWPRFVHRAARVPEVKEGRFSTETL
jgi:dTDP-4-dehydrorhamnose 3,5-epimerase